MSSVQDFTLPDDPKRALEELSQTVRDLSTRLLALENSFQIVYVTPSKPREAQLVFADGTSWDPGSGRGYYEYRSGGWHKL